MIKLLLAGSSLLPWIASTTLAQTAPAAVPAPDPAESQASQVDEIIVTATRRSESLQRVPLAITALASEQLRESGVVEARALPQIAPSLFISTSTSESAGAQVRLRGVGTSSNNVGFEGSVGIFFDGVYVNRPGEALGDLMDVRRVEVLRGPQGTLYGKNTTTGVINVLSNEPTFERSGELSAGYGNYEAVRLGAVYSGPVIEDRVAVRFAGQYSRREGYIEEVLRGRDLQSRDRYQLRAQLLFTPTESFSLRLIAEAQSKDEACCGAPYIALGAGAANIVALGGVILDPTNEDNQYRVGLNGPMATEVTSRAYTAIADWDLGFVNAKLTYGHRDFESSDSYDSDNSTLDILNVIDARLTDRIDTLELQLTKSVGPADLLLGVFAYDNEVGAAQASVFGVDAGRYYNRISGGTAPASYYPVGAGDTAQTFNQSGTGLSVFSHNVIALTPQLKATIGLRWLTEDKDGAGLLFTDGVPGSFGVATPIRCRPPVATAARAFCPANPIGGSFSDSHWSYALGLSYAPIDGTLVYANYSTGYKGGGINAAKDARGPTTINPALVSGVFQPETVEAYEIGVKSTFLDRRVTANLTAFLMDFENFQFQTRDQTTLSTQVQNAAGVRSQGVELEVTLRPTEGLSLGGNAAYISAKYSDETADLVLRSQRLGNSPEWTVQPFITYSRDIAAGWRARGNLNARYVSDYNANVTLLAGNYQPSYTLTNGSISFENDQGLSISVFANNIFDTYYASLRTQAPLQAGTFISFPGEPRTYGVSVRKQF